MKKVLGILTAAVAVLGSTLSAIPADAVEQTIEVKATVDPIIYLRTFKTIDLKITQGDLGAKDKDFNADDANQTTNGNATLIKTAPASLNGGSSATYTKTIQDIFAVWGNTGTKYEVKVTPVVPTLTQTLANNGTKTLTMSVANLTNSTGTLAPDSPKVGTVDLTLTSATAISSGTYTGGQLKVEAVVVP
ncbi:hypothetical protein [Scytonema sp. NUACC26]|uniref:hypothetical protein n=1 Tax=Scytonema sp. NUACC26 TaxID=3140176 RepID=UPI0034DCBDE2